MNALYRSAGKVTFVRYYSARPPYLPNFGGKLLYSPQDWGAGGATARLLKLFSLPA